MHILNLSFYIITSSCAQKTFEYQDIESEFKLKNYISSPLNNAQKTNIYKSDDMLDIQYDDNEFEKFRTKNENFKEEKKNPWHKLILNIHNTNIYELGNLFKDVNLVQNFLKGVNYYFPEITDLKAKDFIENYKTKNVEIFKLIDLMLIHFHLLMLDLSKKTKSTDSDIVSKTYSLAWTQSQYVFYTKKIQTLNDQIKQTDLSKYFFENKLVNAINEQLEYKNNYYKENSVKYVIFSQKSFVFGISLNSNN
ncbi:hypothetical protein GVAV_003565 [Gurleya vavrai]